MDIGIGINSEAARRGKELDVFIKSSATGQEIVGNVWPGSAYFPDFNNPRSKEYWIEGLMNITKNYEGLQPSGIWNDMNEIANIDLSGEKLSFLDKLKLLFRKRKYSHLPFNPSSRYHSLDHSTLSLDAAHYYQADAQYIQAYDTIYEFDWHNLNGFTEGIATQEYLERSGK